MTAGAAAASGRDRRKKTGQWPVFFGYREDHFLALSFSQSAFILASILAGSAFLQASSIFFLSSSFMAPPWEAAMAAEANTIYATIADKTLVMIYSS